MRVARITMRSWRASWSATQALLCHRSPDRAWYPDVWDLPGGHVEAGETRAMRSCESCEELDIVADRAPGASSLRVPRRTSDFDCRIWIVAQCRGRRRRARPLSANRQLLGPIDLP